MISRNFIRRALVYFANGVNQGNIMCADYNQDAGQFEFEADEKGVPWNAAFQRLIQNETPLESDWQALKQEDLETHIRNWIQPNDSPAIRKEKTDKATAAF